MQSDLTSDGRSSSIIQRKTVTNTIAGGGASEEVGINGVLVGVLISGMTAGSVSLVVDGIDMFFGGGAAIAASKHFVPLTVGSDAATKMPVALAGKQKLVITGATNGQVATVNLYYR